jgi:hypothetical protein
MFHRRTPLAKKLRIVPLKCSNIIKGDRMPSTHHPYNETVSIDVYTRNERVFKTLLGMGLTVIPIFSSCEEVKWKS